MLHRKSLCALSVTFCLICLLPTGLGAGAALVDDAKKEGTLLFYGSMTTEHHGKLVAAFTQEYPDLFSGILIHQIGDHELKY